MLDAQSAIIRDAADALAVIDRALTTIEYMLGDPGHCEGTRARLERDKAALREAIRWVQGQIADSWGIDTHPKRQRHPTNAQIDRKDEPSEPIIEPKAEGWTLSSGGWQYERSR